ncbi:ABC transporter substrate-binding protein, partial [Priestia megaterium]|uniref:ABC transporter substrate-binding protein n=1 Tax=Priestia megaterium TaxID=1404 RepID=UPI00137B8BF5
MNWITNATWAGSYLADENGYYEEAGLDVDILTGGPNVDFMAALSSGQALAAFAGLTEPATLNQDNGDYVVVGTMYQKSPLSFISRAEDDITEP